VTSTKAREPSHSIAGGVGHTNPAHLLLLRRARGPMMSPGA
jgi:hypothetical protein